MPCAGASSPVTAHLGNSWADHQSFWGNNSTERRWYWSIRKYFSRLANHLCCVQNDPVSSCSPAKPIYYPALLLCHPRLKQVEVGSALSQKGCFVQGRREGFLFYGDDLWERLSHYKTVRLSPLNLSFFGEPQVGLGLCYRVFFPVKKGKLGLLQPLLLGCRCFPHG